MKKIFFGLVAMPASVAAGFCVFVIRQEPTIKPNTYVGTIALGGLTKEEAAKRLRVWWESERILPLKVQIPAIKKDLPEETPGKFGVTLDDQATVAKLPLLEIKDKLGSAVGNPPTDRFEGKPVYKVMPVDWKPLSLTVKTLGGTPQPAKVAFQAGNIIKKPEVTTYELETSSIQSAVVAALESDHIVKLPVKIAPKRISDEQLANIKEVVSEFTTRFPAHQTSRNANIKLASSRINGLILLPGEKFSFNGTVGRRTLEQGFKLAGVYKNGKHDTGIGGGICQVSTTLYNAALFANLKVNRRTNHSMPVAYVPVGRDATVDYGSLDLSFENNSPSAIAICSQYQPGKLTFRVLGKKEPGLSVKIAQGKETSWDKGTRTIVDRALKPGAKKVVEKGSRGHKVNTFRYVYKNGVLIRKESLGTSFYNGGERIIAVGPGGASPAPSTPSPNRTVGTRPAGIPSSH